MAFREVTVVEVREVLRQWLDGVGIKKITRRLGIARNTVRRYLRAAEAEGIAPPLSWSSVTEEQLGAIFARLDLRPAREHGESWAQCEAQREFIKAKLDAGLRLVKVQRLLSRSGVKLPYPTLHRFAATELDFGGRAPSPPVADCAPGAEVQVDTGWMTLTAPDEHGKRRRFRAWIFTAVLSRHRFVYPCFRETPETAIEACEAAWAFFGGVFAVLIPDNTKAIIKRADPLEPLIVSTFLEYAQSRGFHIDPARARHPKDKARVERSVPDVREDCFAGEVIRNMEDAHTRAKQWSLNEYGMRRHTRTQRMPLEYFEAVEKSALKPAPTEQYHVPKRGEPKVAPDQHVVVEKALYSLPYEYRGKRLETRADPWTVRFYYKGQFIRSRPRQPPGGRDTVPSDFPPEQSATAARDIGFWQKRARTHGKAVGEFAEALLAGPLPWTRLRRVFALLGLAKRYGDARAEQACARAVEAKMYDVRRLERMLKQAHPPAETAAPSEPARVIPIARYLRDPRQFALPLGPPRGSQPPKDGDPK